MWTLCCDFNEIDDLFEMVVVRKYEVNNSFFSIQIKVIDYPF